MSVVYDNSAHVEGQAVTTLTTPAFTITSNTNRAGFIGFAVNKAITSFTTSLGGVSGVLVAGTDSGLINSSIRTVVYGVTAPPSGSQTATASWTTAADAGLGVSTASGVDQTTPLNNGGTANDQGINPTVSLTITSTSGDLTHDVYGQDGTSVPSTNQTQRWSAGSGVAVWYAGDSGPGTGTATHTETKGNSLYDGLLSGANFKQVAGGAADIPILVLQPITPT